MFLSKPASLVFAELAQIGDSDFSVEASYVAKRQGTVHGIGGWFTAELTPTVRLSNVPPNRTPSWSHTFMPLEWPLSVEAGDRLQVKIYTTDNATQWQWQITHQASAVAIRVDKKPFFRSRRQNMGN